ncbi:DUF2326 domain-containing protein [Burkholderia cenocepacia]|uniref:DUF2326 domain-containing protein n=1 Tax=Burkholderia cenocepacia TaxID=95486 RepID=UPI0015887E50|nr:DUF2326 domain-containing protein [Burkholderia cenocepacia]
MLIEVRSSRFRVGVVFFHPGLNVVLGDKNATNSIGKSTMLMVVDFVFGGDSFLELNKDAIDALEHHDYEFCFCFDKVNFYFRRQTINPRIVFRCDEKYNAIEQIDIKDYSAWLKGCYLGQRDDVTFRQMVGLFSRVWPKPNVTNVRHPLHVIPTQSSSECVGNLIKFFGRYGEIASAQTAAAKKESEKKALDNAFKYLIVEKINKSKHAQNVIDLDEIRVEVESIKADIAKFALNIREVIDKDLLELKKSKDSLLERRFSLRASLQRTERNLKESKFIQSKQFDSLREFFPDVNGDRIAEIELFHSSLAGVLKEEFKETAENLKTQLASLDETISEIDRKITDRLKNHDNPIALIERVSLLSEKWNKLRRENEYFEKQENLRSQLEDLKSTLSDLKISVLDGIRNEINKEIEGVVGRVYGEGAKSPVLNVTENNYSYQIVDDTGTGKAYSNLVIFDLSIFGLTDLPILIHDSPLFKNVENSAVAKLVDEYCRFDRQSFIALDEVEKYGSGAAATLRRLSVLNLDSSNTLYLKNWGRK